MDLRNVGSSQPGIEPESPVSPEQAGGFFTTEPPGKPYRTHIKYNNICLKHVQFIQFSSVTQLCPTLCDPMNCTTPGFRVHHQLPEFTQTHVHCVSDAIQPSHPLSSSSPPAPNPSQYQSLFQWVNSSREVTKLEADFCSSFIRKWIRYHIQQHCKLN